MPHPQSVIDKPTMPPGVIACDLLWVTCNVLMYVTNWGRLHFYFESNYVNFEHSAKGWSVCFAPLVSVTCEVWYGMQYIVMLIVLVVAGWFRHCEHTKQQKIKTTDTHVS